MVTLGESLGYFVGNIIYYYTSKSVIVGDHQATVLTIKYHTLELWHSLKGHHDNNIKARYLKSLKSNGCILDTDMPDGDYNHFIMLQQDKLMYYIDLVVYLI